MRIFQKNIALFLTALLLLSLILAACSKRESYSDSIPCEELMDAVTEQLPINFGYESFDGEQLRSYCDDTKLPDDTCLRYSVLSEDINEIGIFHTPDEQSAKQIETLCKKDLQALIDEKSTFIASYAAEELPKLEGGEVRRFGNYTVYAILSEDDRTLAFETIQKKLTEVS